MKSEKTIRLLIVDDHAMFLEGLARTLEKEADFTVAGLCASVAEAMSAMSNDIDLVLLDVDLGNERALDFVDSARRAGFVQRILVVTAGISGPEAIQLVQAGVAGIMHKHSSVQTLCENIRKVVRGEPCMEPEYVAALMRSMDRSRGVPAAPRLTERDRLVLRGIFQGLTNKDLGTRLGISEGAVKASIRQLFEKLSVKTRAQAVKVALEQHRDQL